MIFDLSWAPLTCAADDVQTCVSEEWQKSDKKHEGVIVMLSQLGDYTFIAESLCYNLEAWSLKDISCCIMGNVGSSIFGIWLILEIKSQIPPPLFCTSFKWPRMFETGRCMSPPPLSVIALLLLSNKDIKMAKKEFVSSKPTQWASTHDSMILSREHEFPAVTCWNVHREKVCWWCDAVVVESL